MLAEHQNRYDNLKESHYLCVLHQRFMQKHIFQVAVQKKQNLIKLWICQKTFYCNWSWMSRLQHLLSFKQLSKLVHSSHYLELKDTKVKDKVLNIENRIKSLYIPLHPQNRNILPSSPPNTQVISKSSLGITLVLILHCARIVLFSPRR